MSSLDPSQQDNSSQRNRILPMQCVLSFPPPRRGRVRVGATAAQLDALYGGENNPHPSPPPAWGREKLVAVLR
jgi:hypothetical protein